MSIAGAAGSGADTATSGDGFSKAWGPRLGQRLEAARKRANLTRAELAARLSVTEETVRRWERGGSRPSGDRCAQLLATLAWETKDFSPDSDTSSRPPLAERLYAERKARGISQASAASMLGVAQATYAGWEIGRSSPGPSVVNRIADFLGTSAGAVAALALGGFRVDIDGFSPLGRVIGARRAALRMTREALADRVGVRPRTIATWEVGDKRPPEHSLRRLAEALEMPVDALLTAMPSRWEPATPVGRLIRERQRRLGLTRRDVARRAGVDEGTVSRWLHGRSEPEPDRLALLDSVLSNDPEIRVP